MRNRRHPFAGLSEILSSKMFPSWLRDVYGSGDDLRDSGLGAGTIDVVLQEPCRAPTGAEGPSDMPPGAVGAVIVVILQCRISAMSLFTVSSKTN